MVSGIVDELRLLYARGDYETVLSRAEQLQHRSRSSREKIDGALLSAIRIAALVRVGRAKDALDALSSSSLSTNLQEISSSLQKFVNYVTLYISWAINDGVDKSYDALSSTFPDQHSEFLPLKAQLCYRLGKYAEASKIYRAVLKDKVDIMKQHSESVKSNDSLARAWTFVGRRSASIAAGSLQLSAAELEEVKQSINEIATNLMASLVLAGETKEALAVKYQVAAGYEIEYNAGCAAIFSREWISAKASFNEAERLLRAVIADEEEEDLASELVPILVQQAFLNHVCGSIAEAEQQHNQILRRRVGDQASLAVAANNAAVALGQQALEKQDTSCVQEWKGGLEKSGQAVNSASAMRLSAVVEKARKDRGAALFDALKRMKATSGFEVERKLTLQQRRAVVRNRAILLVQMGRFDACKHELEKLKESSLDDPLLPLIEAALIAKQSSANEADKLLCSTQNSDTDVVRAARVKLAAESGNAKFAAQLLDDMFPGRAAAIATAAAILRDNGMLDEAENVLRRTIAKYPEMQMPAKYALAKLLVQAGKHRDAAAALKDLLLVDRDNHVALGHLVVATSYFDADEAERMAESLPLDNAASKIDVEYLESTNPPRKRSIYRSESKKDINKLSEGQDKSSSEKDEVRAGDQAVSGKSKVKQRSKTRKRKKSKKQPSDYDPNGPPPDPERWIPKTLRSSYKKKKKNRDVSFRGAQGADAAAADAAQLRDAERSAARVADNASDDPRIASSQMPKGTKNKKKSRRR